MSKEKENKETLKVRMLGGFSMIYQEKELFLGKKQTSRVMRMLQALLYAGPGGMAREQLLEGLFGSEFEGEPSNNLSVTACSLRKLLKESRLAKEDLIHTGKGRYWFGGSLEVQVDAHIFETLAKKAKAEEGEEKLKLLKEAVKVYKGHFLPALSGDQWVTEAGARYQHMYDSCMEEICTLLTKRKEYEELFELCGRAASLYPLGEWQVWQMECLLLLGRPKDALTLYNQTASGYFSELDGMPSRRVTEFFQKMSGRIRFDAVDLNEIQTRLREEETPGGYYCPYPSFVGSYRMAARIMEDSGQSVSLLLCTLSDERTSHKNSPQLKEISNLLAKSIREALNRGDIFTRYNMCQFLVILMGISKEECPELIGRIDAGFRRLVHSRRVRVAYRVASL